MTYHVVSGIGEDSICNIKLKHIIFANIRDKKPEIIIALIFSRFPAHACVYVSYVHCRIVAFVTIFIINKSIDEKGRCWCGGI